mgnify:FL=1
MSNPNTSVPIHHGFYHTWLQKMEKFGNKLPNPAVLFLILLILLAIISYIMQLFNMTALDPKTQDVIHIKSLISTEGLDWLLSNLIKNYIHFPPLGMILVLTLGLGVISEAGLLETLIYHSVQHIPKRYVTFTVVLVSFISHLASNAAIIIMPPLAAMLFRSLGRHPLAGFACSVAALESGFTANIFIGTTDVLLSGITTQAAHSIQPKLTISPIDNWFFIAFSVLYLTIFTTLVTEKFIEPHLGAYNVPQEQSTQSMPNISKQEQKALRKSGIAALIYIAIIILLSVPDSGLLRNPQTHSLLDSPLLRGIIPLICGFLITVGLTYGISIKKVTSADTLIQCMSHAIKGLSNFLVMAFFIAQFIAAFTWTNMASLIAMKGAIILQSIHMTGLPAFICFMLFSQLIGLCIASGSAIWAMLSTIFVPMFMMLGYHPAWIQAAFRAGNGSLNSVSLTNPFLPFFLDIIHTYKKDSGIGTFLSLMMPYAIGYLILWYALFIFWYCMGWPVGPGISQYL